MDGFDQFPAQNGNLARGLNAAFYLLPLPTEYRHHDIAADHNAFFGTSGEHKHVAPPRSPKLSSDFIINQGKHCGSARTVRRISETHGGFILYGY
jgi:hypothetical protein